MKYYEYKGVTKKDSVGDSYEFEGFLKTNTTRGNKVAKLIEKDMLKEKGVSFMHLEEFAYREVKPKNN